MNNNLEVKTLENTPIAQGPSEVAALAREQAEMQGAIVLARTKPRDEAACFHRAVKAFERVSLAEAAEYAFPRGRTKDGSPNIVSGPSVDLARECARNWQNLWYGMRIIDTDPEYTHIRGYCIDLENNLKVEAEAKFKRLIYRKERGWVEPDEREQRELINRHGAICMRNAILQVLPPDLIEAALAKARETLEKASKGQLESDREQSIQRLITAADKYGITIELLRGKLGHDLTQITPAEFNELKRVLKSIADGQSKVEDHFSVQPASEQTRDRLKSAVEGLKK